MQFILNNESRVTLNLSLYAYNILNEDSLFFFKDKKNYISTIVNKVFLNYYLEAKASIKSYCDELDQKYSSILEDTINSKTQYSVIQKLIDSKKKEIINEIESYPKEKSVPIKFNKEARKIILDSEEADNYKACLAHYIKAIIEEYTHLPFYQREKIIYKDKFEVVEQAINKKKQLKVIVASNKKFDIIPYKITTDKLSMFNYIVGYYPNEDKVVSYRISRADVKQICKSGIIKAKTKKIIEDKISKYDIPFLTAEPSEDDICIELDKTGMSKYNSQLHMRPAYNRIEGNKYYFSASKKQIKYYFFKFGKNAKVLEPKSLAKEFEDFYKNALNKYEN